MFLTFSHTPTLARAAATPLADLGTADIDSFAVSSGM